MGAAECSASSEAARYFNPVRRRFLLVFGILVLGTGAGAGWWASRPAPAPAPESAADQEYQDIDRADYEAWMQELGYTE